MPSFENFENYGSYSKKCLHLTGTPHISQALANSHPPGDDVVVESGMVLGDRRHKGLWLPLFNQLFLLLQKNRRSSVASVAQRRPLQCCHTQ